MFSPIAVENIAFPQSSSLSTLDSIPESFEAWNAYSNVPTSSTYTTQSFTTGPNQIMRWGMGPNNQILGIQESAGGIIYKWNANTDTFTTHGSQNIGSVRNVVWDNLTNSWVLCGTNAFLKISCENLAVSSSITVPTNAGSQYPAVVAFGGKAYAAPLASTNANTAIAIFDLVANTATTSSAKAGSGGFWGACLTSVGTIYFAREVGATNNSIYEYNPTTGTGTAFATMSGNIGYGITNLPDGNVFIPVLTVNQTAYIINPVNKGVQTIATAGFGYLNGICVGQNGHAYGIGSDTNATNNGIWGFNTTTQRGYKTQYAVQPPSSGGRGFQDIFSLADGRLVAMPGQNNSGRLVYYNYLSQPANNTISTIGATNPIIQNAKGN
jgi:hypothetical protein